MYHPPTELSSVFAARQGAPAGEYLGLVVYVACLFYCGGFLDYARNDIGVSLVGRRGYVRAVSTAGDFSAGKPPRASVLAQICFVPFLLYEISQLMPLNDKIARNLLSLPPRGKALKR